MKTQTVLAVCAFALCSVDTAMSANSRCTAQSTSSQRPLVELFTSEGCSSCPPADRWLSAQRADVALGKFSAIAWHVDYWDYLGWKDPLGIADATPRQRWLAQQSNAQVYTPGVFLNGREWRGWARNEISVSSGNPAPELTIEVMPILSKIDIRTKVGALNQLATLHVVTQRLDRETRVLRGENAGKQLRHDFSAAAQLLQPLSLQKATQEHHFAISKPEGKIAVTAFIENAEGVVLQSTQLFLQDCEIL